MKIKIAAYLATFAGLLGMVLLVAYQGVGEVVGVLGQAGWGLLVVALFHLLPLFCDTSAWYALLKGEARPGFGKMLSIRWMREGIDGILPVAQVGGSLVSTRLLMLNRLSGSVAGASVVLDLTMAVITQSVFTLLGLWLLVVVTGSVQYTWGVLGGLALTLLGIGGFILFQHRGLFGTLVNALSRIGSGDRWLNLVGGAERLDHEIKSHYRRPGTLLQCGSWQLLAWLVGTGEVWLALYYLGHPVSLLEAMMLESLGQAIKNAAFAVPGALGVQEGGFMLLGGVLGLAPETALALSLAKRIRVLSFGIPAVIYWQMLEGHLLWKKRRKSEKDKLSPQSDG